MKDIELALFTGVDIPIPECQIIIHQPSIKEISMLGERWFLTGVQVLCIDKEQFKKDNSDLSNTTNFQIFMTIMHEKEARESKESVIEALSLIVPNSKVTLTPRSLLLNYNGANIIIDEGNFDSFQEILRQVFCLKKKEDDFNPANAAAAKIAEKIKKGRAKVAHLKGEDVGSVYARYISALSVPNIVYILRKELDPEKTMEIIQKLTLIFEVVDLKASDLKNAAAMLTSDYEDAIQMCQAARIHAEHIVTRNIRDFKESSVQALTPAELLLKI
jgi:hypothetical protein